MTSTSEHRLRNPDHINLRLAQDLKHTYARHDRAKLDAIRAIVKAFPPRPAHGGAKSGEAIALTAIQEILKEDT